LLSLAVYFFDFFDDATDYNFTQNNEKAVVKRNTIFFKLITAVLILSCLVISYFYSTSWATLYLLLLVGLGILYPIYFKKLTKKYVGFKDIYVAVAWVLFEFFFFVYYPFGNLTTIIFLLLFMFTRDLMGASYCDIKDIELDKQNKLLTFASILGKNNLVKYLLAFNVISLILLSVGNVFGFLPSISAYLVIPILIITMLILIAKRRNKYPSFYIDLEYCIWFLLLIIVSYVQH